jgi:MFS family permease
MLQLIRTLSAPLSSLVLLILGSGLFNTFVSIRLEIAHYSAETIGAVTAALYIGILLGSFKLGPWIEKVGHIRAFTVFALVSTLLVLAQAVWLDPVYWAFLRLACGVCTAGVFIVIESWLLMQSPRAQRGAVLSLYLAVFYAALSLGQFLINIGGAESVYPFFITAGLSLVSVCPIVFQKVEQPKIEKSSPISLGKMFRISPLGFLGGVISGMLLAIIYGLVPFYGKEIGMGVSEIGTLMGVIIFGGLSFQWPIGRWADKTDRRRVLNTASFMTTVFAVLIALMGDSPWLLLPLGWFFGGFSFTIYPLSMAYTCEKVAGDQIVAATGGFVLSYGIGAIAGPLLAPLAMWMLGHSGLFYFLALISLLLALIGMKRPVAES